MKRKPKECGPDQVPGERGGCRPNCLVNPKQKGCQAKRAPGPKASTMARECNKPGQVRNPATGRCHKPKAASSSTYTAGSKSYTTTSKRCRGGYGFVRTQTGPGGEVVRKCRKKS